MQRRVLLGAGAAALVIVAALGLKSAGRHEATKVVDKDFDQIAATLPPGYAAVHGATDVNAITGTVTVHNLAVSRDGKPVWSAETLTITGADQQALHDVFDPAAYPNGHPAWTARRLLIADASASNVSIPDDGPPASQITIKAVTLHQLAGRPFMLPPTRDQLKSPAFRADVALAFALQGLDMHDASVVSNTPKPVHVTLADVTLRDYQGGQIGKLALSHAALDATAEKPRPTAVQATLQSADIRDVSVVALLRKMALDEPPSPTALAGLRSGHLTLRGLDIQITPGPAITLDSMDARSSPGDAGPTINEARLQGLSFALKDTPLPSGPAAMIAAFGMTTLTMDMSFKTTTDTASNITRLTEDVALHDLGTLHVSFAAGLGSSPAAGKDAQAALLNTPIDHASLEWHDQGLVTRALNAASTQMHTTPDAVRAQLAMPIVALGFMMPDQPDAADQVTNFLNHPGTFTVTFSPPQPVTLSEVGNAPLESRAHLLGARIQAN